MERTNLRNRRKPCNHSLHEVEVGKENTAPSTVAGLTDELATGCCSDFPLAVHHFQKQYVMGYTTLLFQGITHHSLFYAVYNPVVSEPYMPLPQLFCDTQPCRFRVLYTRHRHIQFPKGAGIVVITDEYDDGLFRCIGVAHFFVLSRAALTAIFSLHFSSGSHLFQREQLLQGSLFVGVSLLMQSRHPRPTFTTSIGY